MKKYLKTCVLIKYILFVFILSFFLLANGRISESGFDNLILNDDDVKEYLKDSKYQGQTIEEYFIEVKNRCQKAVRDSKNSIQFNKNFCTCYGNEVVSYWLKKNEFLIYKTIISSYSVNNTHFNPHIQTIINNHSDHKDQEWKDLVLLEDIKFQESCLQMNSSE